MFFWCRTSKTEPALVFSMFTAAPVVCLRPHGNSWGQWDGLYGINIRHRVTQPIGFLCLRRQVKAFSVPVRSLSRLSLFSRLCHLLSSGMVPLRCALQLPKAKPEQNVYFDRYVFRKNGDFFFGKKWDSLELIVRHFSCHKTGWEERTCGSQGGKFTTKADHGESKMERVCKRSSGTRPHMTHW